MKIFEFDYEKKDGDKSHREVMSLHASEKWVDGIDLTKLGEQEKQQLHELQVKYENDMKPFMKKAFRRFLKEGMTITSEKNIKE